MNCPLCNQQARKRSPELCDYEEYVCFCQKTLCKNFCITFRVSTRRQIYGIRMYANNLMLTTFIGTQIYSFPKIGDALYQSNQNMDAPEALNLLKRFKHLTAFL